MAHDPHGSSSSPRARRRAGIAAKIARDVVLLAQTEVAEVAEPHGRGQGASSTMPHKRNPVGSTLTLACARRVHAYAELLTGGLAQEHDRAAGAWHAESDGLAGALASTAGAAGSLHRVLAGLVVRPQQMRSNLELTRGLIMAERLELVLAGALEGRGQGDRGRGRRASGRP